MTMIHAFAQLSDRELLAEVKTLAEHERVATAGLIATLAELDARRLYLGEGCSSLFSYCTRLLHLSEHAAYGRIEAARTARRHPVILDMLAAGSVNLTTVCLLAPHLTEENHVDVLNAAHHKSKREVEHLVASLRPQPAVPSVVRKLPARVSFPALAAATLNAVAPDDALIVVPGPTTQPPTRSTTQNIQLRCRAHNTYEAELFFEPLMAREEAVIFGGSTRSGPGRVQQAVAGDRIKQSLLRRSSPAMETDILSRAWSIAEIVELGRRG
jgi:hypothetical protein